MLVKYKIYNNVCLKNRHREKIVNFELFYMINIMNINNILLIRKPKYRIVRRLKYIENHKINKDITSIKASYKGYFMNCQCVFFKEEIIG